MGLSISNRNICIEGMGDSSNSYINPQKFKSTALPHLCNIHSICRWIFRDREFKAISLLWWSTTIHHHTMCAHIEFDLYFENNWIQSNQNKLQPCFFNSIKTLKNKNGKTCNTKKKWNIPYCFRILLLENFYPTCKPISNFNYKCITISHSNGIWNGNS